MYKFKLFIQVSLKDLELIGSFLENIISMLLYISPTLWPYQLAMICYYTFHPPCGHTNWQWFVTIHFTHLVAIPTGNDLLLYISPTLWPYQLAMICYYTFHPPCGHTNWQWFVTIHFTHLVAIPTGNDLLLYISPTLWPYQLAMICFIIFCIWSFLINFLNFFLLLQVI